LKFVLIAMFVTSNYLGGSRGLTFQEFDSKKSGEAAKQKSLDMAEKMQGANRKDQFQFACTPK